MIMLIHLPATFLLGFISTCGVPHMNINAIQEQLESLGYSAISSQDNFENSVKCDACLPKNLKVFSSHLVT